MQKFLTSLALIILPHLCIAATHELIVTGTGKTPVKATIANVKIGIEAEGKSSGEVQQSISARLKPALEQLKTTQAEKLQTSVVNVYSILNPANPSTVSGYRGRIEISFSIPTERAPDIIDKIFKAGANQLLSLSFRPDDKSVALARLTALEAACSSAILEARTVMEALGITSSGITSVHIEPLQQFDEIKAGDQNNPNAQISTSAATEIIEQEQTVIASVTIRMALNQSNDRK